MLFENCTCHLSQDKKIIFEAQDGACLVCQECFKANVSENNCYGVFLCDGTIQYFFQWNNYLIDELRSLLKIISQQGNDFLFKSTISNISEKKSQNIDIKANTNSKSKQILSFVITQHINLLNQNISFMSQPKSFTELINPQFLRDLFTITTKTVQNILEPIKKEFQAILKKQFSYEYQIEWNYDVINVIESIRQQILNDWVKDCVREKTVSTSKISKSSSQDSNRIKTQHSIDRSRSSCVSLSFDDEIDKVNLSQYGEFEMVSQDNEIIDRTQSYVIDTKKENEMLLKLLNTNQEEIQILNQRLAQSEQKCQQWQRKYQALQDSHRIIVEQKIPTIQIQFQNLQNSMGFIIKDNDQCYIKIQQLEKQLQQLIEENNNLKSSRSTKYYTNPYYQKQKTDQKLLTQLIELQSQNTLKTYDIQTLVNSLKQTKSYFSKTNFQNQIQLLTNWQKQIIVMLQPLQTLTIKQL